MNSTLLFFVRWPEPGRVKTRLAATVGNDEACRIHRLLAERCFAEASGVAAAEVIVCGTGASPDAFRKWLPGAFDYWEQPSGELGHRLETLFSRAFNKAPEAVAAIGSDSPGLLSSDIVAALNALKDRDVTLLPATDGGYVLIGTRAHVPELFRDMPWSSELLLSRTKDVCSELGLSVAFGASHDDVDTEEDWKNAANALGLHGGH